tara:strand:- start:374 stop:1012 length:639 start_codon:yes stop_codon:yes gene_type:complete
MEWCALSKGAKAKYVFIFGILNLLSYFVIQNYVTSHEYDLMTALDEAIPLMPEYVWIYHSIVPVIAVTMISLLRARRLFFITMWACVIATVTLNLFYYFFPSFYPRTDFIIDGFSDLILQVTREVDGANNTFPSGHVCFAWLMFWAVYYSKVAKQLKGIKSLYLLWAIGVSLSTLVLKQHYVVDVISGASLATTCFFISKPAIEYFNFYAEQ